MSILLVKFSNKKEILKRLAEGLNSITNKKMKVQKESLIMELETFDDFRKLVLNKLDVIAAIYNLRPKSIYDLAKKIGYEQPKIQKDCTDLYNLGVIDIVEEKSNGRTVKRPIVEFDKIVFEGSEMVIYLNEETKKTKKVA